MSEYFRIASTEDAKARSGNDMLVVHLVDGKKLFCFDKGLFDRIRGQGAISATVDYTGKGPQIKSVDSAPNGLPNPAPTVGHPSDRDTLIMRQVALKAAVEASGLCTSVDDYLTQVRKLADAMLAWLEDPTPF